jgi:hypothetical protein
MNRHQVMDVIDLEITKRINRDEQVHDEDLIHFLMADYRFNEKDARKHVDLYSSQFTEDVEDED